MQGRIKSFDRRSATGWISCLGEDVFFDAHSQDWIHNGEVIPYPKVGEFWEFHRNNGTRGPALELVKIEHLDPEWEPKKPEPAVVVRPTYDLAYLEENARPDDVGAPDEPSAEDLIEEFK